MDDDASIQILEPDADQQYVPERKERDRQRLPKPIQKVADVNWQKPPVLIVERQVSPPPNVATAASPLPVVAVTDESPTRIVNIVEQTPWNARISDAVWVAIRFIVMAIFTFIALVALNPPFVQDAQQQAIFGDSNAAMQRRSASLSRAAAWAAGAGVAYIALPPLWELLSGKVFSDDLMKSFGMK